MHEGQFGIKCPQTPYYNIIIGRECVNQVDQQELDFQSASTSFIGFLDSDALLLALEGKTTQELKSNCQNPFLVKWEELQLQGYQRYIVVINQGELTETERRRFQSRKEKERTMYAVDRPCILVTYHLI